MPFRGDSAVVRVVVHSVEAFAGCTGLDCWVASLAACLPTCFVVVEAALGDTAGNGAYVAVTH